MRKTQLHTWITMFFCVLAVAAEALQERRDPPAVLRQRREPMQSSPAPAAALFRHLDDQSLDYCVLGAPTAERIELVVARDALDRIPGLLRSFAAARTSSKSSIIGRRPKAFISIASAAPVARSIRSS